MLMSSDLILENLDISSLYNMFDNSIDPIAITNCNWEEGIKFLYINKAFSKETGYLKEELLSQSPKLLQGPKTNKNFLIELKRTLLKNENFIGQTINYRKNGTSYCVKWSISPLKNSKNITIGYISFQRIIDEASYMQYEKLLSSIVNVTKNLILVTNLEGVIVYTNKAFNEKLGYDADELVGKHTRILKSGHQNAMFYKKMWESIISNGYFSGTFISIKKDATLFYDRKEISTIKDNTGRPIYYVSISSDISEQVQKEVELENQIYIDSLTNIYNRKKFEIIMERKIKEYTINNKLFSLILLDIDYFKMINDDYGHDMGDYILKELSQTLQDNLRSSDFLFRWGGEEFAILIDGTVENAKQLSEKLRINIKDKNFQSIKITASFGISCMKNAKNKDMLFQQADKALYQSKENGRDRVEIYPQQVEKKIDKRKKEYEKNS